MEGHRLWFSNSLPSHTGKPNCHLSNLSSLESREPNPSPPTPSGPLPWYEAAPFSSPTTAVVSDKLRRKVKETSGKSAKVHDTLSERNIEQDVGPLSHLSLPSYQPRPVQSTIEEEETVPFGGQVSRKRRRNGSPTEASSASASQDTQSTTKYGRLYSYANHRLEKEDVKEPSLPSESCQRRHHWVHVAPPVLPLPLPTAPAVTPLHPTYRGQPVPQGQMNRKKANKRGARPSTANAAPPHYPSPSPSLEQSHGARLLESNDKSSVQRPVLVFDTSALMNLEVPVLCLVGETNWLCIPYRVINELDYFNAHCKGRKGDNIKGTSARRLRDWIKGCLERPNNPLILQKRSEVVDVFERNGTKNDDSIVGCAVFFAQQYENLVLVTDDKFMSIKAKGEGVKTMSTNELKRKAHLSC